MTGLWQDIRYGLRMLGNSIVLLIATGLMVRTLQARLTHASSSSDDGVGIALYTHDFSRGSNQPSDQHCNIADSGAEIQDTLTWTYACFTEQAFGERSKPRRLPDQALVFSVRTAK